jgi:hypothetical protein
VSILKLPQKDSYFPIRPLKMLTMLENVERKLFVYLVVFCVYLLKENKKIG